MSAVLSLSRLPADTCQKKTAKVCIPSGTFLFMLVPRSALKALISFLQPFVSLLPEQ